MTTVLDEYEDEYRTHIATANEKAVLAENCKLAEERRTAISAAERSLEAAKDVIQLMELEGRSLAPSARSRLQNQLRSFRTEIGDLKSLLKELRASKTVQLSSDCMREELFAAHSRDSQSDASERSRMLQTNERIKNGTDRLADVNKVTLDMESTANSILGDLASQVSSKPPPTPPWRPCSRSCSRGCALCEYSARQYSARAARSAWRRKASRRASACCVALPGAP